MTALTSFLIIVIAMLTLLLFMAWRYSQHRELWFDTWVRWRIRAEMGVSWYECWQHLDLDTLWKQFTYDISLPTRKVN
jgi:hypothetical protein